jgi:hypothetical protein
MQSDLRLAVATGRDSSSKSIRRQLERKQVIESPLIGVLEESIHR